jgi:hypothetical protein
MIYRLRSDKIKIIFLQSSLLRHVLFGNVAERGRFRRRRLR